MAGALFTVPENPLGRSFVFGPHQAMATNLEAIRGREGDQTIRHPEIEMPLLGLQMCHLHAVDRRERGELRADQPQFTCVVIPRQIAVQGHPHNEQPVILFAQGRSSATGEQRCGESVSRAVSKERRDTRGQQEYSLQRPTARRLAACEPLNSGFAPHSANPLYGSHTARQKLTVAPAGTGFVRLSRVPASVLVETAVQAFRSLELSIA